MSKVKMQDLYLWCKIPYNELEEHPELKTSFRLCKDSKEPWAQ